MSEINKAITWGFGLGCGCLLFVTVMAILFATCSAYFAASIGSEMEKARVKNAIVPEEGNPAFDADIAMTVAEWQGKGIKKTEPFVIQSKEWAIAWSTKATEMIPMNFQIYVYKDGGLLPDVVANVIGNGEDYSYQYNGSGRFHLEINSGQAWVVKVLAAGVGKTEEPSGAP